MLGGLSPACLITGARAALIDLTAVLDSEGVGMKSGSSPVQCRQGSLHESWHAILQATMASDMDGLDPGEEDQTRTSRLIICIYNYFWFIYTADDTLRLQLTNPRFFQIKQNPRII